jgi:hypothetical protein
MTSATRVSAKEHVANASVIMFPKIASAGRRSILAITWFSISKDIETVGTFGRQGGATEMWCRSQI